MAELKVSRSDSDFAWIVPRHPTQAMLDAGLYHCSADMTSADLFTAFHYMVDAAQQDDAVAAPSEADMLAFGASDPACYLYPGEDQQAERLAYCAGAASAANTRQATSPITGEAREGFAPCPTCHQYSHSIGEGPITEAFKHFHTMYAHPVRGHPMGYAFDEKTRDAAQVILAALPLAPREGWQEEVGLTVSQRDAICRAAEFLDACAGKDIEIEGMAAISVVEALQDQFLCEGQDDCFHLEVLAALSRTGEVSRG